MRILFIAHRVPYPPNKGDKLRAFWQLRELSRQHTVDLFCFCDDPEDKKYVHELSQYCNSYYLEDLSFLRSRVQSLTALMRGQPFTLAFFHSPRMAKQIDAALQSGLYDRIVVFSSSMAEYVESANNIPRVLDLVDVDSDKWLQYAKSSSWPLSWLWRREAKLLGDYESALVRDFSTTVVCTAAEGQLLRAKAPTGRIEVLQNFLDVDAYTPALNAIPDFVRAWKPYLIFSGSMDYRPNIDAVRFFCGEVFPLIRREVPEANLVIAGRNPDRTVLALQADSSVHVTGSVSDMRPYLWGATAAVAPMRIARGVQNKILEALASGVPVVSSSTAAAALPPALQKLLAVADTPQAIAAAAIKLLRNGPEIASHDLRATLKTYIEHLDLHAQLQRLVADPTRAAGENQGTKGNLDLRSLLASCSTGNAIYEPAAEPPRRETRSNAL
ncbi:MAG TPA: TIGR03087 family PEP-CTERM/XrtA system glycosyltransferase [Candidatus Sulfotelmatobacter sp.]|jgi:sugar transferase (PEP-CTERM/EpsH1 system associated)|nr:TIGR03087 family PEP-CTERM/XrtA system glycosyltransferase [Candidatus Sulfotelmatobacter sp.]